MSKKLSFEFDGRKFANLAGARIADYLDRGAFREALAAGADFGPVEAVFHQGACTDTTDDAACTAAYGAGHLCVSGACIKASCRKDSDCGDGGKVCVDFACNAHVCKDDNACTEPNKPVCDVPTGTCGGAVAALNMTEDQRRHTPGGQGALPRGRLAACFLRGKRPVAGRRELKDQLVIDGLPDEAAGRVVHHRHRDGCAARTGRRTVSTV